MTTTTQGGVPGYDIGRMGLSPTGQQVVCAEYLQYQDGSSDKIYVGIVSQTGHEYFVEFFYGRRGAVLTKGAPTICESEYVAKAKMDAQLATKKRKGYKIAGTVQGSVAFVPNSDRYETRLVWPMGSLALPEKKRDQIIESSEWIAEEKSDGVRLTVHITPDGLRFFGRNASKHDPTRPIEKTDSLKRFSYLHFPDKYIGTIIDVEALADGMDAAQISGMLNATDGRDTSMIYFKVFDIIQEALTDVTGLEWKYRRMKLTQLFKEWQGTFRNAAFSFENPITGKEELRDIVSNDYFAEGLFRLSVYTIKDKEEFHNQILANGGEGTMWKNIESKYKEGGKPANHWYKWKKQDTADVVVVGYTDALPGKYAGLIGAIRYGQWMTAEEASNLGLKIVQGVTPYSAKLDRYLVEIGQCSGMTDAIREEVTKHKDAYETCVMEVEFMERTKTGALRHPRWVRWREDKKFNECIYTPTETIGKMV